MSTPAPANRRRRASSTRSTGRQTTLLALMVVALTAGMLALAGTTPRDVGALVGRSAPVALEQRTFVCDAGLPGATVTRGSTSGGPERAPAGAAPFVIEVDRSRSATAYAGEQAGGGTWSAWQSCPEPQSRWWFLGASGAAVTHDTVLHVVNPRAGAAVIDVDVYGANGPVAAPALHGLTLDGGSAKTFDLARVAPAVGELAVRVLARRGLVTVAATDEFSPGQIGKEVREWLPPTALPARTVTITGLPAKPSGATLVLANPTDTEAIAKIAVVGTRGTFAPEGVEPVTVGPHAVATLPLRSVFDGTALALRITAERRITAGLRATDGGDIAYGSAVEPVRGSTTVAVPAARGGKRTLVLSSTGAAGQATVTGYDARGTQVLRKTVAVAAQTSVAVELTGKVAVLRIEAARPTMVAGVVGTGPAGVVSAAVGSSLRSIRLPVVRQGW
ncbi:MAG: hypothetical protein J7518_20110 [Nocardioidaceae bacterium]|nr:hypothetical protein [Nocardioidaceae bacterium]